MELLSSATIMGFEDLAEEVAEDLCDLVPRVMWQFLDLVRKMHGDNHNNWAFDEEPNLRQGLALFVRRSNQVLELLQKVAAECGK